MADYEYSFPSLAAIAEHGNGAPERGRGRMYDGSGWRGTNTYEEAVALVETGWAEPRAEVDRITRQITADTWKEAETERVRPIFAETGMEVDIARFLADDPEMMIDYSWTPAAGSDRVLTVLISVGALAHIRPESIIRRGAAVVALVEIMNQLGVATEVYIESKIGEDGGDRASMSILVKVKASDEELDTNGLMMAVAHPSTLRRFIFAAREQTPAAVRRACGIKASAIGASSEPCRADEVGATVVLGTIKDNTEQVISDPRGWVIEQMNKHFGIAD